MPYIAFEQIAVPIEAEPSKNTLIVFRHAVTTDEKDRDRNILRTGGVMVDLEVLKELEG